ncbi:MAG: dihydroorotase [Gammaproteobacteria bacterium]
MAATRIVNARMINEGRELHGELLIRDGRIEAIGSHVPAIAGAEEVNARGRVLMPGMIDDQVHFREPGFEHKADIYTESRAAVAGGITSYMDMPNSDPLTVTREALQDKHSRARDRSVANYAFYLGATNDNLDEIKRADPTLACGIKVFMGASTGNMLVDDETVLEAIFASSPLVIATHCEDTPTILENEARMRERYGDDVPMELHPEIRSAEACFRSSSLAVNLAKRHGSRLNVLHLTTEKELALFVAGPAADKRITVEVCAHHLYFDDTWYRRKGADIKCNPAVKRASDRNALLAAVAADVIDIIATDHAPHTREEKNRSYFEAPAGLPLVQHALLSVLEHHHDGRLDLTKIVEKICHAPAVIYGVEERGFLREGHWADLVLVDLEHPTKVDETPVLSKCGWTPFAGLEFRSRIDSTWVNGNRVWADGALRASVPGMALRFARR